MIAFVAVWVVVATVLAVCACIVAGRADEELRRHLPSGGA